MLPIGLRATRTSNPTVALAARVFGVSEPLIREALKRRRKNGNGTSAPNLTVLSRAWSRATPAVRAEFGRVVGVNVVWDDAVAPNLI